MPRPKREPITTCGRPAKDIDWDEVDRRLEAGCMGTNLARLFDMHPDTFYNRVIAEKGMCFTDYCKQKRKDGDDVLRLTQFETAVKEKNVTMQIWLGKQRLDQKENHDMASTPNDQKLDTLLADIKAMKSQIYPKSVSEQRSELVPKPAEQNAEPECP